MTKISRRNWLKTLALGASALTLRPVWAAVGNEMAKAGAQNAWALNQTSNFHAVYDQLSSRGAFYPFLCNVFHLYPEQDFQQLITAVVAEQLTDQAIYNTVQSRLGMITPHLSSVRYALPALRKQKHEMMTETLQLLQPQTKINGYLEIGTTGRYLSALRPKLQIHGDIVLLNSQHPTYELTDIIERGQLTVAGRFVDMRNYAPIASTDVPDASLDLITNFIGFHHAPSENLDGFVRSLHRVLRSGGRMVVRDHAVDSPEMNRRVALAHDVFNMGLNAHWSVNQQEIRHFTSLEQLRNYLEVRGFHSVPGEHYQPGDPTHNALMLFIKI
jgi:SAM-dependent methyltransferase